MSLPDKGKQPISNLKNILYVLRPFHFVLLLLSFALVAFGQPAWIWWVGILSSLFGYAIFWRILLDITSPKQRFWLSAVWYTAVQAVQLSWMLGHPFAYIYLIYPLFWLLLGLQAGAFALLVNAENIQRLYRVVALAAAWTLLEWSRLFFLSGFTWNPAGLALTGSVYPLQMASLTGVYGLSFWVMLINALALRAWINRPAKRPILLWSLLAATPFLYGAYQVHQHDSYMELSVADNQNQFKALLVQTAFPTEETIEFNDKQSYIAFVMDEWSKILNITKKSLGKKFDLIVLPEYVVPFGTYTFLYPHSFVRDTFEKAYGSEAAEKLPALEEPFARQYKTPQGEVWLVNNAFWAQGIANVFDSELVAGLEDAEITNGECKYFSSAIHFKPGTTAETFVQNRYAKRVLLPMAEYVPFSFCKELAASYGIQGSFTPGLEASVIQGCNGPFSLSICYEETFGNLMREGRQNGSDMLINLTSDVWYPNSRLPQQHADHARLRSVENGIPLLRACNTGVTMACDSLGRTVALLDEGEWTANALPVSVPKYHYHTLYSEYGDLLIIGFSLLALCLFFVPAYRKL